MASCTPEQDEHPPSSVPAPPGAPFAHAVDRALVHRRSIAEVYLTDVARDGDQFTACAQWPRAHILYCAGGQYHPTLLLETMRQAVLAVCHGLLNVPYGTQFVMSGISAGGLDRLPPIGAAPATVTIGLARCLGPGRSRSRWQMRIRVGDHARLTGGGTLVLLTPAQYTRVRGGQSGRRSVSVPTWPTAPERVGRDWAGDVCLAEAVDGAFGLRVDQDHPIFYDHPLDHVPGTLLLEAALQRAHAYDSRFRPAAIDTQFHAFLEPDRPCTVECHTTPGGPGTGGGLLIQFRQDQAIKTTVSLTPTSSAPGPGEELDTGDASPAGCCSTTGAGPT